MNIEESTSNNISSTSEALPAYHPNSDCGAERSRQNDIPTNIDSRTNSDMTSLIRLLSDNFEPGNVLNSSAGLDYSTLEAMEVDVKETNGSSEDVHSVRQSEAILLL